MTAYLGRGTPDPNGSTLCRYAAAAMLSFQERMGLLVNTVVDCIIPHSRGNRSLYSDPEGSWVHPY